MKLDREELSELYKDKVITRPDYIRLLREIPKEPVEVEESETDELQVIKDLIVGLPKPEKPADYQASLDSILSRLGKLEEAIGKAREPTPLAKKTKRVLIPEYYDGRIVRITIT